MPSSGSTHSRPSERPIPLWLLIAGEDHPKICTGRRLLRRRLALPLSSEKGPRYRPLLLDPHAPSPLSRADLPTVLAGGLLGVDCSWNRLADRGGYPDGPAWLQKLRDRRRLPWLIATNPQHYGRLGELNTAEAFCAALWVLGAPTKARRLIGAFAGGPAFLEVNAERLEGYAGALDADGIRAAEARFFA